MNSIDFTQPDGFPFDQSILDFLQKETQLGQQAAAFGGAMCIISGCVVSGSNVGAGIVAINGEILPFLAGTLAPKVIIVETDSDLTYYNGMPKTVVKTRVVQFGDDFVQNLPWANFKRNTTEGVLARLERLEAIAAPDLIVGGTIRIWMLPANQIPPYWQALPDNSPLRGTVLRGKTAAGGAYPALLGGGGDDNKIVTENNIQQFTKNLPTADGAIPSGSGASFVGLSQTSGSHSTVNIGVATPTSLPVDEYTIVDYIQYIGTI